MPQPLVRCDRQQRLAKPQKDNFRVAVNIFGRTQVVDKLDANSVGLRVNGLCTGFDGWNRFARLTHFRYLNHFANPTFVWVLHKSSMGEFARPAMVSTIARI